MSIDILARLEAAFLKYKIVFKISVRNSTAMTKALDAYELVAKKGPEQLPSQPSAGGGRKSFLGRKSVVSVYELMATDKDNTITTKSQQQQNADDVIAHDLKKRVMDLVTKQKYLATTYSNLDSA